ncbi:hypothetical protein HPP92_021380 [Vanilla planifolia]|uniref:F-box domain-containing protein n=1 Tax=Vanilla planifolia TaxID=51239 RepID=A0A835PY13_VANPL|nr:hypothetical protein HPP92_021380 [Vanilla planifolia]
MEPSSNGSGGERRRATAVRLEGGKRGRASAVSTFSVHNLGADVLCIIFSHLDPGELVRCAAVCKMWNNIIFTSTLMRDLYDKIILHTRLFANHSNSTETPMKFFERLALEQHKASLIGNSAEVYQWNVHSSRISLCRMKRGLILSGAEDKVMRLWSAESFKCLNEYHNLSKNSLVDFDFDENKIVGLTKSQICIWTLKSGKGIFCSRQGIFSQGICMRYMDPEAVVGCDDGRAHVFDMYSGRCTRIIWMHGAPISCLALSEDQLVFGGSNFGTVAMADLSTGEQVFLLKSACSYSALKCLCLNSHLLFAGSIGGYAHCWDLRTLKPLWERRVSPNVLYSMHHLANDTSTLAVAGLDGVLRIMDQSTGEVLSSLIMEPSVEPDGLSANGSGFNSIRKAKAVSTDVQIHSIPRLQRPPITSLAVGLRKIVTAHNETYLSMWRFNQSFR